jgi:hypothetical protein
MGNVAVMKVRTVARPLKVLIPMIQSELQEGNDAGREHYLRAGQMLIEAKDLVGYGGWGRWLKKNFDLSDRTASTYMRWAREHDKIGRQPSEVPYRSLHEMTGGTERRREQSQSKTDQAFRRVLRDISRDDFIQERQARDDEMKLHRDLALELVDLGYRGLATKLHPDRGGSKEAMARLNRVRDELKAIAQTRRYI